ncbi:Leucine-rich repeat-containing protein 74B [Cucumispora dikerogammari]|nr:Leucine-rich repeat-containing protein 74B [Cucumispora dikerogammari]
MKVTINNNNNNKFINNEYIQTFIESIEKLEETTFLDIFLPSITFDVAMYLCVKIKEMKKLKHLKIIGSGSNGVTKYTQMIFHSLLVNIDAFNILSLTISSVYLDYIDLAILWNILRRATHLEHLNMNNCCLGGAGIISILVNLIKAKNKLTFLDISSNNIDWRYGERIGLLLNQLSYLDTLNIRLNSDQENDIVSIIRTLKGLQLKELDLSYNIISGEGCSLLGMMFGNHKMQKLNMSTCNISDAGLSMFLSEWYRNISSNNQHNFLQETFAKFSLNETKKNNNKKSNEGKGFYFLNARSDKKYQKILDLAHNNLTQGGIKELSEFLKKIINIKIYISRPDYEDLTELIHVVETNSGTVVVFEE